MQFTTADSRTELKNSNVTFESYKNFMQSSQLHITYYLQYVRLTLQIAELSLSF